MKKNYLELAIIYAQDKKGQCLSDKYHWKTKLEWKCRNESHSSWFADYFHVVNSGTWCPQCRNDNLKLPNGLEKAKKYAKDKGGKCLSKIYINSYSKLEWKCKNKEHNSWFSKYSAIASGVWCPECGANKNVQENRVRNILNYLFKTKFLKSKLKWNINPKTKKILELDGYSKKLGIAFEYQGEHHFKQNVFNKKNMLDNIQYKDQIKKENCLINNLKLITINYIKNINCFTSFMLEINRAIKEVNTQYDLYHNEEELQKIFNLTLGTGVQKSKLLNANKHAKFKNGKCLSQNYINNSTKMEWKCHNENHLSWFSPYNSVVSNKKWCPECAGHKIIDGITLANEYANLKKGKCLSTKGL